MKRLAKKKTAHPELKKSYNRYAKAKKIWKDATKDLMVYRKLPEVKTILKNDRQLSNKRWAKRTKVRKTEDELASFDPIGALSESNLWENNVV